MAHPFPLDQALRLATETVRIGAENSVDVAVVVTDEHGQPVVSLRHPDVSTLSLESARRKAVLSASLRMATESIAGMLEQDTKLARAMDNDPAVLALPGGFPVVVGGRRVGALGVAGGHYTQDQHVGSLALQAFSQG
jgi:uncharacterized protein GlcG (DUF336 family)